VFDSRSTAYRKIDLPAEDGLLGEGIHIRSDGAHAGGYRLAVEELTVSLSSGDGVETGTVPPAALGDRANRIDGRRDRVPTGAGRHHQLFVSRPTGVVSLGLGPRTIMDDDTPDGTDGRFDDAPISRRRFARLSAAAGAALALPGNATATADADEFDAEYGYVLAHTPTDHAVPTLVRFGDAAGVRALEAADLGAAVETTLEPEPAAYGRFTAAEAERVADLPTAETLSYSPGSNPFWRLGYYPFGVFPAAERSVDYIDFEQMVDGMELLEAENDDRMRFFSIGASPGHDNAITGRGDPKPVYVVEVTNDVDDREAFAEKTKVFYNLSLHGDERAGVESGCRFLEGLFAGSEPATEAVLDDVVLLFCFSNPDGWVARHPQYDAYGVPAAPLHERGNAAGVDTNRQYPIYGWITPAHYPAEPRGSDHTGDDPGVDRDVPDRTRENAVDALGIVEHFRGYENLEYGADFHGMLFSDEFVLGLICQGQLDNQEFHELYEMCRVIDGDLEEALERWTTVGDTQQAVTGNTNPFGTIPSEAFDYANSWDTIGYTGTGYIDDWMAHPEPVGLDMTPLAFEMAYSNIVGGNAFNQEVVRQQVTGYNAAIRTLADYATREVTVTIETGGDDVAYVRTDALRRSSEDLSFLAGDGETELETATSEERLAPGEPATFDHEMTAGLHSLTVTPHVHGAAVAARLVDPDGETVRSVDPEESRPVGGRCCDAPTWRVLEPAAGEWTLVVESTDGEPADVEAEFVTLAADGENPDPADALGYEQRPYESTPLSYFEDIAEDVVGGIDAVSVDAVADGALDGYDHLVVVHDEGLDDAGYVEAVESFVDDGGNLVVTDTGVDLLGALETDLTMGIAPDDVEQVELYIANLAERNEGHPLLSGTRPIQRELWKVTPMGYSTDTEAPMSLVDEAAFTDAGGTVAGRTEGAVGAGSIAREDGTGVHVIGGLLPPAKQTNLHPFGLLDYAVAFLGHVMLTNALGFRQVRRVDGEVVERFERGTRR